MTMDKIINTKKFKPDKDFEGVDREGEKVERSGPVQFEEDIPQLPEDKDPEEKEKEDDIYGFSKYFSEAKGEKPEKKEERTKLGIMHASAGGGVGSEMSDSRRNIGFVPSTVETTKKYKSRSPSPKNKMSPTKRKRSGSPHDNRSPKRRRSRSPVRDRRNDRDRNDRDRRRNSRDRNYRRDDRRDRR